MRSKSVLIGLFVLALFLFPLSEAKAQKKVDLVGGDTLNFTLPSTHDRIITYAEEYYGKNHLIITFFPAAYTPV
jgi:HKD family nuclease